MGAQHREEPKHLCQRVGGNVRIYEALKLYLESLKLTIWFLIFIEVPMGACTSYPLLSPELHQQSYLSVDVWAVSKVVISGSSEL